MTKTIEITFPIDAALAPALIAAYQEIVSGKSPSVPAAPAAPIAPVAPTAPAAPSAPAPTGAALDGTGVPYNPAFHAPSGRLSAKNEWTLKKGADKAAADAWKKQHAGKATPPAAPAAPALNAQFGAPAWPLAATAYPPVDYITFGALYQRLANDGKITGEDVTKLMQTVGLTDPAVFVTDDAKRAHAFALLKNFDV